MSVTAKTLSKGYLPVFLGRLFHAMLAYIIEDIELAPPFSRNWRGTDSLSPGKSQQFIQEDLYLFTGTTRGLMHFITFSITQ